MRSVPEQLGGAPLARGEGSALDAELYALLEGAAPWGFTVVSADEELLGVSPALGTLFALSPGEVEAVRALGPTRAARDLLMQTLAARTVDPARFPCGRGDAPEAACHDEITLRDGRVIERQAQPARDREGRPRGRVAFFRDVSDRRRAEREMRDRARGQAALAALAELAMNAEEVEPLLHAACATVLEVIGVDGAALVEVVDGELELRAGAGLPPEWLGSRTPPPPSRPLALLPVGAVLTGAPGETATPLLPGFRAAAEVPLPGRDGVGLLCACTRAPHAFGADDLRFLDMAAGILASALARARAEAEVLERERRMRAVFDSALDAMVIADDAGVIRDANPAACALLGSPHRAVVGRRMAELVEGTGAGGEAAGAARALTALPGAAERTSGETEVALPGQRARAVEFAAIPRILPGRHLAVMRDVTERKQLHSRLALADRMVSVGTLAAGVAHELNNPLAYVNANLGFLAERLARVAEVVAGGPAPDPAGAELVAELRDALRDARDGAERMRVIIRDLKTFSRGDDEKPTPVDVRAVLECCVSMAWNEIRHRARLVKDLAAVPPVLANEARLGQVFLNLLVNAAQAIREGQADGNEIRIVTSATGDGRVAVDVRDTGSGIPPELLSRIFDPFFTTKAPGVGTGLGLAICHSIVAGLGGDIMVESRVGAGTTFRVLLPVAPRVPAERPPPAAARAARPRGRVLVVDDEPLVGAVFQRTLQAEHDITAVTSARAALARVEAGEVFDVVLSDLLMPEMTGMDLHAELSRRDPALARRMVFLTGGAFTPGAREFVAREGVVCLEKPFELDTIRALLARRLEEQGPAPGRS